MYAHHCRKEQSTARHLVSLTLTDQLCSISQQKRNEALVLTVPCCTLLLALVTSTQNRHKIQCVHPSHLMLSSQLKPSSELCAGTHNKCSAIHFSYLRCKGEKLWQKNRENNWKQRYFDCSGTKDKETPILPDGIVICSLSFCRELASGSCCHITEQAFIHLLSLPKLTQKHQ